MPTTEAHLDVGQGLEGAHIASFEIWPHRSLGRGGTAALLGFVAAASAAIVIASPPAATWPLAIGAVVTVAALALALWASHRSARLGETVEVGPDHIRVTRAGPRGRSRSIDFSTGWVRVALADDRHTTNRLVLSESGRSCTIGACLSTAERAALAAAIRASLADARSARMAT